MRPIRLPDDHLPQTGAATWTCRQCSAPWPCDTAASYLTPGRCDCGSPTWWEQRGPRRWHTGPRCHTAAEAVAARAADTAQGRAPHYPPSHYYPPKPYRPRRQRPPYRHDLTGPGDVRPGLWLWVKPGGLHPGWGDIHLLAMLTAPRAPKCEIWLSLDGTVHDVRADHLILLGLPRGLRADWARWTVARHLEHAAPAAPARPQPVQPDLFSGLTGA
ncbi:MULTISPECIES: hypothetical protein [unclassified Streptomyces]|uniref:hypothetical protein n=1 Tax=unclassified Streptomyces TaxID=2593676 RepID=UPI0003653DF0|nr:MULTISPECIES: hypothetical protein [unclassified Streptomyces]MYX39011.1 hypothetical protein [Streptomyces sp. SID8377]